VFLITISLCLGLMSGYFVEKFFFPIQTISVPSQSPSIISLTPTIRALNNTNTPAVVNITSTPNIVSPRYSAPATWRTVKSSTVGVSFCLPPHWVMDEWNNVFFERDSGYRPPVFILHGEIYGGGSRRNQFIERVVHYENDADMMRNQARSEESIINGLSVLTIKIPSFPETLVFVVGNTLVDMELANWSDVNNSRVDFMKDIYTSISCMKAL